LPSLLIRSLPYTEASSRKKIIGSRNVKNASSRLRT
jgi:hypothetical protein